MLRGAVVAALLGFALTPPASGTVSVVLGSPDLDAFYTVGETITLTVHVTANAGELDDSISGRVNFPTGILDWIEVPAQNPLPPSDVWLGFTFCSAVTPSYCTAFSQSAFAGGDPIAIDVADFLLSTLTFEALAPGHVDFTWRTTPSSQGLDFFGVTNAAGYSVTIVPEPSTALLLGAGVVGFAARRFKV
jgi:hypothetical protein